MATYEYADINDLTVIANEIKKKQDAESGKGLSQENYTTAEKTKLSGIETGAQVNVIEHITVNGTEVSPTSGTVALTVMTNTVDNLTNYYKKTETYTQAEVNSLISAITTLDIQVVNTLPTQDISTTTIYLVPSSNPQTQNAKDEYINTPGTSAGWELIGSTSVDLSQYVQKSDIAAIPVADVQALFTNS